jgi:hypothetical protein
VCGSGRDDEHTHKLFVQSRKETLSTQTRVQRHAHCEMPAPKPPNEPALQPKQALRRVDHAAEPQMVQHMMLVVIIMMQRDTRDGTPGEPKPDQRDTAPRVHRTP